MKKYFCFLLSLIFIIILGVGCAPDEPDETIDPDVAVDSEDGVDDVELVTVPRSTLYEVETETLTDSIVAPDGTEVVYVSAEYPIISNPHGLLNVMVVNQMYAENAQDYIDVVKLEFEEEALNAYSEDPETFEKYSFVVSCDITYNKNCFLSIKRDYNEQYGDFVGTETYADVYDMTMGLPLYADEIITGSGEDVLSLIFLGFSSVAEEFPERFVDGYVDILNSAITGTEFYLTEKAMVFVLQPGIVTHPEYGCLMFEMPYAGNEAYFLKLYEE